MSQFSITRSRLFQPPLAILFSLLTVLSNVPTALSQSQDEINNMLRQYSDDIATEKALVSRGLGSPSGAAISYSHRGKVYLLYAQKPDQAVADFSEAIRLLKTERLDQVSRSTLADSYVFRARACSELKKRSLAIADATDAIRLFQEMIAGGAEHAEPRLVYALKTRVEALTGKGPTADSGKEDLVKALTDIDQAIPLLEKWSKKGANDEFFQSELKDFKGRRTAVAEALKARE